MPPSKNHNPKKGRHNNTHHPLPSPSLNLGSRVPTCACAAMRAMRAGVESSELAVTRSTSRPSILSDPAAGSSSTSSSQGNDVGLIFLRYA